MVKHGIGLFDRRKKNVRVSLRWYSTLISMFFSHLLFYIGNIMFMVQFWSTQFVGCIFFNRLDIQRALRWCKYHSNFYIITISHTYFFRTNTTKKMSIQKYKLKIKMLVFGCFLTCKACQLYLETNNLAQTILVYSHKHDIYVFIVITMKVVLHARPPECKYFLFIFRARCIVPLLI